jgi:light-regulated signal transduction histidine kinase (bacteriophytochrome)
MDDAKVNPSYEDLLAKNQELERRVSKQMADLSAANQELDSFAYSVSHDLRAPLRAVEGFARIMIDDFASQLDPEARRCIDIIVTSTKQMERLIDALLSFSRLSQVPIEKIMLNMTSMAKAATQEALSLQPAATIDFRIPSLLQGFGEPGLIRQVFVRLFSNAIKFTRSQPQAVVEVGSFEEDGSTVYFVKDNGVGFDMRYASKLFGMFQRLHRTEEFEGAGAGLAIVKRIIQRHGGRTWAEGNPNEGACFYFSLPAREAV